MVVHWAATNGYLACQPINGTAGASNGKVENLHMLAERTRRAAHGFTNHTNYRRRLIARYGIKWATVPTRRIRGHKPRPIA